MSIKKTMALIFLLFAGMVILAHAVVPHHYHNGIPCVAEHHDNLHDSHSQGENAEDCFFSTVYVRLSNNDRQIFQSFDFDLLPCFLILFSDYFVFKIEKFEQKPYLLPFYTEYVSQSLGLRAPPVLN